MKHGLIQIFKRELARIILSVCICIFYLCSSVFSELRISDIPILEVKQNSQVSFNILPYIYNTAKDKKLDIEFSDIKEVDCIYRADALLIKPKENFFGLTYVNVNIKNRDNETASADIIVKVKQKSQTVVTYKPDGVVSDVFIAGEFNGWNPKATRLTKNENGVYSVQLDIPSGSYQYKFVVDGKWISDLQNQSTVPDGFGGKNSVLTVEGKEIEIIPFTKKKDKLVFGCSGDVSKCLAIAGNKLRSVKIKKNEIEISIPELSASYQVVACDKNGNFSNEFYSSDNPWQDGVIYFVFIDRFNNGDKTNDNPMLDPEVSESANYLGGDFQGVIDKINEGYFTKLGVDVLWLSPVIDNPEVAYREDTPPNKKYSGYHGYWPKDFYKVEEHFGTSSKLKELVKVAHKNNMKVIFDAVFNHAVIENEIYKKNPQWFGTLELPDGRKNIRLFDEYPLTTWFDSFNPTFDFESNPGAQNYIIENAIWWIKEFDIDGFRLDAVKHVPHSFWKALRTKVKEEIELPQNKKFLMVGETISSREKIMEYVSPEELDGQFDFPLYWAIRDVFAWETQGFGRLDGEQKQSTKIYKNGLMSAFVGNHDFARFTALADGDIKPGMNDKDEKIVAEIDNSETYKKLKFAFTFILTNPGVPMIYYGDEIGLSGKGDPDNRRLMKFSFDKNEKDVSDYVTALIKIRKENPALRYGIGKTVIAENDFYAYRKIWFDNEILVVMNRSNESISRNLNLDGRWLNLFTDEKVILKKIEISPRTAIVFKKI